MGCDIHACIQGQYKGRTYWWDLALDVSIGRNYPLFAAMADVRNYEGYGITPVAQPRGLPDLGLDLGLADEDCPYNTASFAKRWDCDAHSRSWLLTDEFAEAILRATTVELWTAGAPTDAAAVLAFMREWEIATGGKARIVFFFDN